MDIGKCRDRGSNLDKKCQLEIGSTRASDPAHSLHVDSIEASTTMVILSLNISHHDISDVFLFAYTPQICSIASAEMYKQDGVTFLQCHAHIHRAVIHEEDHHWQAIYATIAGYRDIKCLFHYYTEDCAETVSKGTYAIYAQVRRNSSTLF